MLPFSDHVYLLEKGRIPFKGMLCCLFFFLMFRVETIQTVGPNKRLHNFPLEEKITCEARTFPGPIPSHLLGVGGRGLAESCKTAASCVKLARCLHRWLWLSHLEPEGLEGAAGHGEIFSICFVPCAFH